MRLSCLELGLVLGQSIHSGDGRHAGVIAGNDCASRAVADWVGACDFRSPCKRTVKSRQMLWRLI
jgi:hypothetical protein